jgi:alkylation response protein AidB-like acyl-CoA dehydrogenase
VKVSIETRAPLRERSLFQLQLGQAEGLLRAARAYLFESADEIWQRGEAGVPFDAPAQASARLASVTAVKLAAQAVDLMHDAAGMSAVQTSSALERSWRDVHTITQHVILSAGRYEVIGRVLLGLPPGAPLI